MVQVLPMNYNNEQHYKAANPNYVNDYQQHPTPPPPPHYGLPPPHLQPPQQAPPPRHQQQQQQMPIPLPVPMMNHMMPPHHQHHHAAAPPHHPHHAPPPQPPNFFHPAAVAVAASGGPPPPPHTGPPAHAPPHHQPMYPADQPGGQYIDYGAAAAAAAGYPMGFISPGYYSDITVYVPTLQKHYALNTTILSRSPVLYQRMMEEQSNTMELDLYVLPETFHTIIGHLNRPLSPQEIMFLATEKPQIAIELLEAAEELGLDPLLDALMLALSQNLNHRKTAMTYIQAMEPYQPLEEEEPRRWVGLLEEDIIIFMVKRLSSQLEAFSTSVKVSGNVMIGSVNACGYMPSRTPPMRGFNDLARAFAALPHHLMVRCLEHPLLPVQDAIQRSSFAKRVLAMWKSNNEFHQRQGQPEFLVVMKFDKGVDSIAVVKETPLKKGRWNPQLYEVYSKK
ncbi:hypothetical protein BDF20DRAFT_871566 [Mycotypha africana]|uniref:uncharacterized protein n=1 Tax=Mycotypha africana TaxID=64632 RepID=UPI002301E135|nr:uncharacterized protein BDF20DRAFT_871566 [Mycotypha africana]KAI8979772.1 hypothetical protein BDF20DRAFT_871566 [Mycotypha africana]